MKPFRADLHCHTICSDGTATPEQIVEMAATIGLSGLSITDHDSINAYKEALPLAAKCGIEMISGAEFSSVHNGTSIHILAYAFPLTSPVIQEFCKKHHQRRENRNRGILVRLAKQGMPVSEEDILDPAKAQQTIGRPHIAQAMIKKKYVSSIQEAFRKYLGEGRSCYAPGESFSTQETINLIHEAGGLAVIAHPHLVSPSKIVHELLEMNVDGIECFYANFPANANQRWMKYAEKKGLIMTGGSDFHGDIKPNISLGSSFVNEEIFRTLQKHYLQHP